MWSIFRAIKRSWAQHFISQFSGLIILMLSYSAVLFIALALTNLERIFSIWGQVNQVTIYLTNHDKLSELKSIDNFLLNNEIVKSFKFINSNQAAQNFKDRFKDLSSQKINSGELGAFFPAYYEVQLVQSKAYSESSHSIDDFATNIKSQFSIITDVSYGKSWLEKYISILSLVKKIGWSLILLFLIGSLVVTSNVVKTILFHRRDEIEILEFIGADDKIIYLPQMANIMLTAAIAFLSALFANYILYFVVVRYQSIQLSHLLSHELGFLPISYLLLISSISVISLTCYTFFTIYKLLPRQSRSDGLGAIN
jgi:cell division transport system permease protein